MQIVEEQTAGYSQDLTQYDSDGVEIVFEEKEGTQRREESETQVALVVLEEKKTNPKREVNSLYNTVVYFDIPDVGEFKLRAIIDTGATTCCANSEIIPKEAMEESPWLVNYKGINSEQRTKTKLKQGQMKIGGHSFIIPFTYCMPMRTGDGIDMLLGCNFIRSMYGGLRIEANMVTFYKNITSVKTEPSTEVAGFAMKGFSKDSKGCLKG